MNIQGTQGVQGGVLNILRTRVLPEISRDPGGSLNILGVLYCNWNIRGALDIVGSLGSIW